LFLSVASPTSLAEERVRGSLDVLLTTTLSTREIVWGKWWGAFRGVLLFSILPSMVALAYSWQSGHWLGAILVIGLILAFGAALTSLGLALATWTPRLGRAVAATVAVYLVVTVGWLFLVGAITANVSGTFAPGLASGSPFFGTIFPLIQMQGKNPTEWVECVSWLIFWIHFYGVIAAVLLAATLASFDRCLGRIPDRSFLYFPEPIPSEWKHELVEVGD
jgi:ABC-type transport system involved in multi-copper enzyme maturation permease subunit